MKMILLDPVVVNETIDAGTDTGNLLLIISLASLLILIVIFYIFKKKRNNQ